jgi:hypothetical protein
MDDRVARGIFEIAYKAIQKYGNLSMFSHKTIQKREVLKASMLDYYESTEEFEKCLVIKEFFDKLEEDLSKGYDIDEIGKNQEFLL